MKTKAVFFVSKGQVEVHEIEVPVTGCEDVLVRTEYSAISIGTERWCLLGKAVTLDGETVPFPFIPGYQRAGVVEKVGSGVHDLAAGDRVYSFQGKVSGGHMQYFVCPRESLLKLPSNISSRKASYLSLAQVGYDGATRPLINEGDTAVIAGDGILGQTAAQVFRHQGATVILSGHHEKRLKLAKALSADIAVNSSHENLSAIVMNKCAGGAEIVVEAVGNVDLVKELLGIVKYDGQLVLLGYYPPPKCFLNIHWLRRKATTIYNPRAVLMNRLVKTLDFVEKGVIHIEELITHEFHYTKAQEAYNMIIEKKEPFLGIVLRWD